MVLVGAFTVSDILYLHSEVLGFQYKTVQETFWSLKKTPQNTLMDTTEKCAAVYSIAVLTALLRTREFCLIQFTLNISLVLSG